jgi:hypothetical protein
VLDSFLVQAQQPPAVIEQNLTLGSQGDVSRLSNEQRFAQVLLQLLDLHTQSRRRSVHHLCRTGEGATLSDGYKTPQDIVIKQRNLHEYTSRFGFLARV